MERDHSRMVEPEAANTNWKRVQNDVMAVSQAVYRSEYKALKDILQNKLCQMEWHSCPQMQEHHGKMDALNEQEASGKRCSNMHDIVRSPLTIWSSSH